MEVDASGRGLGSVAETGAYLVRSNWVYFKLLPGRLTDVIANLSALIDSLMMFIAFWKLVDFNILLLMLGDRICLSLDCLSTI